VSSLVIMQDIFNCFRNFGFGKASWKSQGYLRRSKQNARPIRYGMRPLRLACQQTETPTQLTVLICHDCGWVCEERAGRPWVGQS